MARLTSTWWLILVVAIAVSLLLFLVGISGDEQGALALRSTEAWKDLVSPGDLSAAHGTLDRFCADCHEPRRGPVAERCLVCHAGERPLLERRTTSFHAVVDRCADCHPEHMGRAARPTSMSHDAFAAIGLELLSRSDDARAIRQALRVERFLRIDRTHLREAYPLVARRESVLDCGECHGVEDPHRGFFSSDCALCHGADSWSIATFRHPSPSSVECFQCHPPPKSHLMAHYSMVSQAVARQPEARVEQCHICHLDTAWLDIRGVGWYEHH